MDKRASDREEPKKRPRNGKLVMAVVHLAIRHALRVPPADPHRDIFLFSQIYMYCMFYTIVHTNTILKK